MKKIYFTLAVLATLASCTNNELVEMTPKQAITFGNAFVENNTRSIDNTLNSNNLESFIVYGTVTGKGNGEGTVNIYDGVTVSKSDVKSENVVENNGWWYDAQYTQYWIIGNDYNFAAVVNGTVGKKDNYGMPEVISYDAATQKDLLYASYNISDYQSTSGGGVVKFTFNHLLAKAQFTFKNKITTNTSDIKYTYRVSNVQITNAYTYGNYTISGKEPWTVYEKLLNKETRGIVNFGNITNADSNDDDDTAIKVGEIGKEASATSHNQMLLIPHKYTDMVITCQIETILNDVVIDKEEVHTIKPKAVTLEAGNAYNFIIEKGAPGDVIKFSVEEVTGWDEGTNGSNDVKVE